jgi:hypothetical protein
MSARQRVFMLLASSLTLCVMIWYTIPLQAQQANPDRFEFDVVSSFDAKYLGDTPGHIGRGGNLGTAQPNIALGDPVFLGEHRVGRISTLTWDRNKQNLEIEFDPEPFLIDKDGRPVGQNRIAVGQTVWVARVAKVATR